MKTEPVKLNNKIDNAEFENRESEHIETAKAQVLPIVHQSKPQNKTDDNMNEQKTEIDQLLKTIDDSNKKWNSSQWLTGC